jgi:hypothetical protein
MGASCHHEVMGKGRRFLLMTLFLAAAGGMALLMLSPGQAEPSYHGKPLKFWLEVYNARNNSQPHPGTPTAQADEAIKAMGTNAIPILLRGLQQHDSRIRLTLWRLLQRCPFIKTPLVPESRDWEAYFGFEALGSEASNAVPQLIAIYERDPSPLVQTAVPSILARLGPAAKEAAPALLRRGIVHTNAIPRYDAAYALGQIEADPELAVPALIKCLSDPDSLVRGQAAEALGKFGVKAKAAVPALLELWRKEPPVPLPATGSRMIYNGQIVSAGWLSGGSGIFGASPPTPGAVAVEALEAIDPEAAAKTAVK